MKAEKKHLKRKKYTGLQKKNAISGYMFILPFILGFLIFMVQPLFNSLYMSFCTVDVSSSGFTNIFNGIENYRRAFLVDTEFVTYLVDELTRMCTNSLAVMVFSFFVALILNQKFKGRTFVRAIFFLPVILSSGVIVSVEADNSLLASIQDTIQETASSGTSITDALETILKTAGIGTRAFEFVFDIVDGIYDVAIASGIQILIFLSGLQTVPDSMYEAAEMEGCTSWESLWKITFPMVSGLFLVNWVYTIVDFCMRSDNEVIDKISTTMMEQLNYGFASAMSWTYFAIVAAIIGVTSLLISKGVYHYD